MSSHSRSVGADAGGRQSMTSGNATGFINEPLQQSCPVYRESNTTNVSLLFPQENEYRHSQHVNGQALRPLWKRRTRKEELPQMGMGEKGTIGERQGEKSGKGCKRND